MRARQVDDLHDRGAPTARVTRKAEAPTPRLGSEDLLTLQRTAGNRAVAALLEPGGRHGTAGATGPVVVQRDLAGTASVLGDIHAGTVGLRRMSNWAKLLEALNQFEAAEAKLRREQQGTNRRLSTSRLDDLLERLEKVKVRVAKWRKANEEEALQQRETYQEQFATIRRNRDRDGDDPVEPEGLKARQLGAVIMLERRIAFEERVLSDRSWWRLSSFSDDVASDVQDNAVGGALNRLDRGTWTHGGGNQTVGFFGKDKHVDPTIDTSPGTQIGIPAYDPNYSGRSVAMAQIDQLITDKIRTVARLVEPRMLIDMQFATHTREVAPQSGQHETVMGVVGEQAEGDELRSHFLAGGRAQMDDQGEGMALDDPALQRGMNKLQLLDAICGQVDRHMANIFIDTDEEQGVTRVTGIDNDLAFGENLESVERRDNRVFGGGSWRGLPPIADRVTAQAILAITPQMLRTALQGLLAPQEIEATVSRFLQVQNFLSTLPQEKLIDHDQWVQQRQQLASVQTSENSYLGVARDELVTNWKMANGQRVETAIKDHTITSVNQSFEVDEDVTTLPEFIGAMMGQWACDLSLAAASQMKFQLSQAEAKGNELVDAFLVSLDSKNLKANFQQSVRGPMQDARKRIESELPQIAERVFV